MRFDWSWKLADINQDKPVKVFSTFSCGGGSSMGYKRAGFEVLGNVEIDPKINDIYITNNKPRFNYCEDLRDFNKRKDLPAELFELDILDGSPPCTTFSTCGKREDSWGQVKKFKEGQKTQRLDDLFFVFLETVEKLKPKIVIAENVMGMTTGKAKGYINEIVKEFKALGYQVQLFAFNSAYMDVPQARHRFFIIANRCGFPKLKMKFTGEPIRFGKVRTERGVPLGEKAEQARYLLSQAKETEGRFLDVTKRLTGASKSLFGAIIVSDKKVCPTITSAGAYYRFEDKMKFSDEDFIRVSSFPKDYNFKKQNVQFVCGMSVPPNMMANIAMEVYEQWLK